MDDALYLGQLIKTIGQVFAVDRKRVYIIGYSNGGFMAHRLACEYSDLIAGIASLAGVMALDSSRCQPSEPVNILHIHGTADDVVPYGGGKLGGGLPQTGEMPGALETVQMWASHNHCAGPVTEQGVSTDMDLNVPGLDTVVMRYTNCPPGGARGAVDHQRRYARSHPPQRQHRVRVRHPRHRLAPGAPETVNSA